MNDANSHSSRSPDAQPPKDGELCFVESCLEHLDRETSALGQLNAVLKDVRTALAQHDTNHLPALVESQQQHMRNLDDLRSDRSKLKRELSDRLGVPQEQATIGRWAHSLPEDDRIRVLDRRSRLARVADESAALAQTNMTVVLHGMQLLGQVMQGLTSNASKGSTYTPDGAAEAQPFQAIYDSRC